MIAEATSLEDKKLKVEVVTIYALSMPKFIYIQMYAKDGAQSAPPIRIKADKIEEVAGWYQLKLGEEMIGKFNSVAVAGWWIQDEGSAKATS